MSVKFCPIASGSSGNCIYASSGSANILIDAGISGVKISEGLKKINVAPADIDGIFVTHEHSDHIKGVGIFSRRFNVPIYATRGSWSAMPESLGKIAEENVRLIDAGVATEIKDMCVMPFRIPHDAAEPVGYSIIINDVKITVATDMGCPTDEIREVIKDSDILLIEANHDVEMLKKGPYPYILKKRILSDHGHLSNEVAAELIMQTMTDKLKHIYLGHLSAENNHPRLAFDTVYSILKDNAMISGQFKMRTADRFDVSPLAEV